MYEVKELRVVAPYRLWARFSDGFMGMVDVSGYIGKGLTADLKAPEYFAQAFIEPGGGIAWPNGYDICPNFLRSIAVADSAVHPSVATR